MKKSKIIAPALGVLLLSTAASVSGTVAWFTASRSAAITASVFKVVNTEAALEHTVAAVEATGSVTGTGASQAFVVKDNTALCDASYDFTTAYDKVLDAEGAVSGFSKVGVDTKVKDAVVDGTTYSVFAAISFTITFKYTPTSNFGLFFDAASSITSTDAIAPGFRMGFSAGEEKIVWAPQRASSNYINATDASAVGTAVSSDWMLGSGESAVLANSAENVASASVSAKKNYLGTFAAGAAGAIAVKCVVWMEGTDEAVVDANLTSIISTGITANLSFFVRPII